MVREHLKTVVVLGAGASKADGAPLQSELLRGYFESYQHRPEGEMFHDRDRELATYFDLLWGIDVDHGDMKRESFPTFEEALGLLELAHARGEFFKGFSGLDQQTTRGQELRSHLTALIALFLEERLRQTQVHHRALVASLQRAGVLARTVFLSLNYDILIDNAIEHHSAEQGTHALSDYGVEFASVPHRGGAAFPRASLLLKLHGSLNWLFCPTCNGLWLFPHHKVAAGVPGGPAYTVCPACHEPRVPIIIPPTFFKVMSNFYLQQIWKRAEDELKQADRIVFCGYSFPDADMHFKYLLKRAEVNRSDDCPLEVYVVNRPPERSEEEHKAAEERSRYERFFRRKDLVHWTRLSFEQFAKNPTLIEGPSQWL